MNNFCCSQDNTTNTIDVSIKKDPSENVDIRPSFKDFLDSNRGCVCEKSVYIHVAPYVWIQLLFDKIVK